MLDPKINIMLPSYNKHEYVKDAIDSVLNQTYTNWDLFIYENSDDEVTRKYIETFIWMLVGKDRRIHYREVNMQQARANNYYPTACLINRNWQECKSYEHKSYWDCFYYLSDDNILEPDCLEALVSVLRDENKQVAYCAIRHQVQEGASFRDAPDGAKLQGIIKHPTKVDNVFDGEQVMIKAECLDKIPYPYYSYDLANQETTHCDGVFLQRLLEHYDFYPVSTDKPLIIHRRTTKSTWRQLL